ncbi:MAG: hypothetical protein AAGD01_16070 [Acidobacteriota bacterium]
MAEEFLPPADDALYYQLTMVFTNLPANTQGTVSIYTSRDAGVFSIGENSETLGGYRLTGTDGSNLNFNSFTTNSKQVIVYGGDADGNFSLNLYVLTPDRRVGGNVNLPQGATVTFISRASSTTVGGNSSWSVPLS